MEVFPPIDFLPARALPNTSRFLAGVISLCLSAFNCALALVAKCTTAKLAFRVERGKEGGGYGS